MARMRTLLIVLVLVLVLGLLAGCATQSQEATFIGYKQRPAEDGSGGVAIVQLSSGLPAEAKCTYSTLENGAAITVVKKGETYKVVSISPDWK